MCTVWDVDKYKITFKLVINWTNGVLLHIVVSLDLSRPGIVDARARRLRNTGLEALEKGHLLPVAGIEPLFISHLAIYVVAINTR